LSYIIVQSKHDDLPRLFLLLSLVFLLLHCPQFLNLLFSQQKEEVRSALERKKEEVNSLKGKAYQKDSTIPKAEEAFWDMLAGHHSTYYSSKHTLPCATSDIPLFFSLCSLLL